MTSAPRPSASPGRQINAAFPCAMPRSAPPTRAGSPIRRCQDGISRFALASTLAAGLGALSAGCAAAEGSGDIAAQNIVAQNTETLQAGSGQGGPARPLPAGLILASTIRDAAGGRKAGMQRPGITNPRAACLAAAREAEAAHNIPPGLMVAVALAESGLHAYAMNIGGRSHFPSTNEEARRIYNAAGPGQNVMAGCVQVNARVHARGSDWPLDPWQAADWGAGYLRSHYERSGNWADALRRWNGGGAAGSRLACRVQAKLAVTNPGSTLLSGAGCGGNTRERRNGETLLEIAEGAE